VPGCRSRVTRYDPPPYIIVSICSGKTGALETAGAPVRPGRIVVGHVGRSKATRFSDSRNACMCVFILFDRRRAWLFRTGQTRPFFTRKSPPRERYERNTFAPGRTKPVPTFYGLSFFTETRKFSSFEEYIFILSSSVQPKQSTPFSAYRVTRRYSNFKLPSWL